MEFAKKLKNNWIILALGMCIATLTNHSHGEVVYRKLSTIQPVRQEIEDSEEMLAAAKPASQTEDGLRIAKVNHTAAGLTVLLSGGRRQGLLPGTTLEARRSQGGPGSKTQIPTALLKTIEVRDDFSLALVTADGSQVSAMHFQDFPGIMVGDFAYPQELTVAQTLRILPTRTLKFDQLFVDPKGLPATFELSTEGKAYLLDQARVFVDAHAPLLLVEGHTDPRGDRQSNQIESYQRALTVRQILIDELGLDPERLVAIGLGESEVLDEPYLPGRDREARRIVLRAKKPQN